MEIFNTHKFLYTLFHEGRIEGHTVHFINRNEEEQEIELSKIEIGASTVSCKLFDTQGNRYLVPFIRVRKVFYKGELVWDATDTDMSNAKVIRGFD